MLSPCRWRPSTREHACRSLQGDRTGHQPIVARNYVQDTIKVCAVTVRLGAANRSSTAMEASTQIAQGSLPAHFSRLHVHVGRARAGTKPVVPGAPVRNLAGPATGIGPRVVGDDDTVGAGIAWNALGFECAGQGSMLTHRPDRFRRTRVVGTRSMESPSPEN